MTQYISKSAIKAEIKRRIKEHHSGYLVCLKDILSFVDTLEVKEVQEESVSEEMEEAAFDYAEACKCDGGEKLLCVEHFKAGAKWGKNQAKVEIQSQSMALANGCPKEPVSEELEDFAKRQADEFAEREYEGGSYDRGCLSKGYYWGCHAGAKWKAEQFEKEWLKQCDALTEEQAQIESGFFAQHLKENNRTPTFIDAIEYGMKLKLKDKK